MNKIKKSRNKGKPKTSLFKLSNKRLNKLAKQGKLKKKIGKKKLASFVKYKTSKKSKTEPIITEQKVDPDIPLHEADYDYFSQPGRNYEFLAEIGKNRIQNKRKKQNEESDFNLVEGKFAKKRKHETSSTHKKFLLPLKSKEKGVIHQYIDEIKTVDDSELLNDEGNAEEIDKLKVLKSSEISLLSFNKSKEIIAAISLNIIESDQQNIGKLKDLLEFLKDDDVKISVKVLAMLSLSEVLKDIIPGYSIRPFTEQEIKQQMKKDTKQLHNFEQSLLNSYSNYLEILEIFAKGKYASKDQKLENKQLLRVTALKCLTSLLVTHPHFNYRTNIISVIMPFILHKDNKTSDLIFEAIKSIFKDDKNGVVTLEIVRLIGRIIKTKNFNVKAKVLDTFLLLKIKEINRPGEVNNEKATDYSKRIFTSRKAKKRQKMLKYLEKELKDASALDDKKLKIKMHTEIIGLVFLTYFRILKCPVRSPLLPNVLQGLAKFAHLINVSYFDDIFNVMSNMVESSDLSRSEALHCIQTALTLLIGQGSALNIDPLKFYTHLYNSLSMLCCSVINWKNDIPSTVACLDLLLVKRRKQMSPTRCMAFLKRLSNTILHLPASIVSPLIFTLKSILQTHPQCISLLSVDEETSLIYKPESENPDHAAADGATLYELHLLRSSYDLNVAKSASHLLNINSTEKSRFNSNFFSRSAFELFDPNLTSFTSKLEQIQLK